MAADASGYDIDGRPYFSGVPCSDCGKFVGRDGAIHVEYFEMSNTIASVDGTCRRCLGAGPLAGREQPLKEEQT